MKNAEFNLGKARPGFLLAMGRQGAPHSIVVEDKTYQLCESFKHDSWAATAVYVCGDHKIVCKHNRIQPIFFVPTFLLGYFLAYRERYFLQRLAGVSGIPKSYVVYDAQGQRLRNAAAHDFIPGRPMSVVDKLPPNFFKNLFELVGELHRRRIAYVDMHKQENILVGEDNLPHLIDFQISVYLPDVFGLRKLFQMLAESDLYHLDKHQRRRRAEYWYKVLIAKPWWIKAHRAIAVPIRTVRRRLLVLLGVRVGEGKAHTELAPEVGHKPSEGPVVP